MGPVGTLGDGGFVAFDCTLTKLPTLMLHSYPQASRAKSALKAKPVRIQSMPAAFSSATLGNTAHDQQTAFEDELSSLSEVRLPLSLSQAVPTALAQAAVGGASGLHSHSGAALRQQPRLSGTTSHGVAATRSVVGSTDASESGPTAESRL